MRRNGARLAVATDRPTALDGGAEAATRYAPGGATLFLSELAALPAAAASRRIVAADRDAASSVAEVLQGSGARRDRLGRAHRPRGRRSADRPPRRSRAPWIWRARRAPACSKSPTSTNARGLREAGCLPDAGPGLSQLAGLERAGGEGGSAAGERAGAADGQTEAANDAPATGLDTERIRVGLESGELKSLILFGVDPLRDFPDTEAWKRALAAADHLVVFSTFENATTAMADVVLPAGDPRRERRHRHAPRWSTAAGKAKRRAPRRHPPELGRARRALAGARP